MNKKTDHPTMTKGAYALKIFEIILVILIASMIGLVIVQVLARYVFQRNVRGVEELARLILVWGGFLGAGYALIQRKHIIVDFIVEKSSERVGLILQYLSLLVLIFVSLVMIISGLQFTISKWVFPDYSTALLYPRSLFYLPVPIFGVMTFIHSLWSLIVLISRRNKS